MAALPSRSRATLPRTHQSGAFVTQKEDVRPPRPLVGLAVGTAVDKAAPCPSLSGSAVSSSLQSAGGCGSRAPPSGPEVQVLPGGALVGGAVSGHLGRRSTTRWLSDQSCLFAMARCLVPATLCSRAVPGLPCRGGSGGLGAAQPPSGIPGGSPVPVRWCSAPVEMRGPTSPPRAEPGTGALSAASGNPPSLPPAWVLTRRGR